jgi:uncharacterized membrane protein YciS (DUF1049 family)
MLVLAIILLALVATMVVASFVGTSEEVVIEFANVTITSSVGGVFVTGVVAGLVALASLVALKVSISRRRQHNKEVRELRRRAEMAAPATTTTVPDVRPNPAPSDAARNDATDLKDEPPADQPPADEPPAGADDDTASDTDSVPPEPRTGPGDDPAPDAPRS